jgi:Protein of unknown function DUF262.
MSDDNKQVEQNPRDRYEFDKGIDEKEDTLSEERIETPYDPTRIKVDPTPMTIFQVMRKVDMEEINLQPKFQRKVVWDDVRQSRLIESILIRIPLPSFYLDAIDDNEWLVVDGLQRLWTLDRFYNKKDLHLQNLEFLGAQLNGKNFDELPRNFQRQIEETHLNLYVIKPDTPPEVKFAIFYRINTGGMVLSTQEIRHCLFQGTATELLIKLADSEEFLAATTDSINTKRMDDRECVLRYCAFHLKPYTEYKESNFNEFLSSTMASINKMQPNEIEALENSFLRAMRISKSVFGQYAFRKMYGRQYARNPINKSLFEIWSVCLEGFNESKILTNKDKIIDGFIDKINKDNVYFQSITQGTGGVTRVRKRFSTTLDIIKEAIS